MLDSHVDTNRCVTIGPEFRADGANFRVWAPDLAKLAIKVTEAGCDRIQPMKKTDDGYFEAHVEGIRAGALYGFLVDGDDRVYPDPASRYQPEGPHGRSQLVNPAFAWTDQEWLGPDFNYQVLYELHIGTFTEEGTFAAAERQLEELKAIGITTIELMPVAEFDGQFGWGYDGVNMFAPHHLYGQPQALKSLINKAHDLGLSVILDVVYNHFGGSGNYISKFCKHYFTDRHANEWGEALNFDGEENLGVREFFIQNAVYWVSEFHFDGLRLDATQQIYDDSNPHIIKEIVDTIRGACPNRALLIVGENEPQDVRLIEEYGTNALWNDDFHHSARVALTSKREGYYADYKGSSQELVSAAKHGFLYQGQLSFCRQKPHGTSVKNLNPNNLITFIENHDQVANSGRGQRLHQLSNLASYKAVLMLLLLGRNSPMLFQGQEFFSTSPFGYFAHHEGELADLVDKGRKDSLRKFRSLNSDKMLDSIPRPDSKVFFESCRLRFDERITNKPYYAFVKRLLELRNTLALYRTPDTLIDGSALNNSAFCLRLEGAEQILLMINLGADMELTPAAEPLLAPPPGKCWEKIVSSEDPEYGGLGCPLIFNESDVYLPGRCATAFIAANTRRGSY